MTNFWDNLRKNGRIVDEGIKRLEKQWESPRIFVSKYGELVEEAGKNLEDFLESIKDIHDEIIQDNQPRGDYVTDVDRFSDECTNIYEDLRQQAFEIEGLLSEFGYQGLPKTNGIKDDSILTPDMMDSLEISEDPDNSMKVEKSSTKMTKEELPRFIATPVIKSVGFIKKENQCRDTSYH